MDLSNESAVAAKPPPAAKPSFKVQLTFHPDQATQDFTGGAATAASSSTRALPASMMSAINRSSSTGAPSLLNQSTVMNQFQPPSSSAHSSSNLAYMNTLPRAKITFTLVNMKEFAVRASEAGVVPGRVLTTLKLIPNHRFDWGKRCWVMPLSCHDILNTNLATSSDRIIVEALPRNTIAAAKALSSRESGDVARDLRLLDDLVPAVVLASLADFQKRAVLFIHANNGRALVADEMGLGKTRTAIAACMLYKEEWPVLIICPSSARYLWQSELIAILGEGKVEGFSARDISVVESTSHTLQTWDGRPYKFLIASYNLMSRMAHNISTIVWGVVIADESHYLKTLAARRTQCILPIIKKAKRALLLSGTPALSRPIELFSQLHALEEKKWPNVKEFASRYCHGGRRGFHGEYKGASNTGELHVVLSATCMIRRLKKEILRDLPPKARHIINVEICDPAQREELRVILESILASERRKMSKWSKEPPTAAADAAVTADGSGADPQKKRMILDLFDKSGEAKVAGLLPHLGRFLDNKLSGKCLIFAHHRSVLAAIQQFVDSRGVESIRIDGNTSSRERQARAVHFQTVSTCRVAVLAITAAGVALTLTAASTVFFAELYWTPGSLIQAEDRCHRIGQVNAVRIFYFLAKASIDDVIWPLVKKKMRVLGEVVEGVKDGDLEVVSSQSGKRRSSGDLVAAGASSSAKEPDFKEIDDIDEIEVIFNEIVGEETKEKDDCGEDDGEEAHYYDVDKAMGGENDMVDTSGFSEQPDQLARMYLLESGLKQWPSGAPSVASLQQVRAEMTAKNTICIDTLSQPAAAITINLVDDDGPAVTPEAPPAIKSAQDMQNDYAEWQAKNLLMASRLIRNNFS